MRKKWVTDATVTAHGSSSRVLELERKFSLGACVQAAMELPAFPQSALIRRAKFRRHLARRMMPSQITPFRRSAAQCFCGIIALSMVSFVCLQLKADFATTAFIYLAVIVLLSLIGSYVVSAVFTILSDASAIRRREMTPKPGLALAAKSSTMAPEPIGEWAVSCRRV